jgi:hypothetical protein
MFHFTKFNPIGRIKKESVYSQINQYVVVSPPSAFVTAKDCLGQYEFSIKI